jgi:hypothetical protein
MAEQDHTIEAVWTRFLHDNGFQFVDAVPKEFGGQKALYVELDWKDVDAIFMQPKHALEAYGLRLLTEIKPHEIKTQAVVYIGTKL